MSFLNTTANIVHRTALPSTTKEADAISLIHDHDFIIRLDPHLSKYDALPATADPSEPLPPTAKPVGETKCYKVTDVMHNLPSGLWDSNVVSTVQYTNLEKGALVRMQSPLSVVLQTEWRIDTQDNGELELVIDCNIACSRLLCGIVKGRCEANQPEIVRQVVERLMGEKN